MFRMLTTGILSTLFLGFVFMIMQSFDWDIFAVIEWLISMFMNSINFVAEKLSETPIKDWLRLN